MRRAALLLVVGSAFACRTAPAGPDPSTRLEECEALDGRAAADDCYERLAVKVVKPGYCERIVGPRVKNNCYQHVAPLAEDAALCAKIDETQQRTSCRVELAKK